jgi:hypothetical protein
MKSFFKKLLANFLIVLILLVITLTYSYYFKYMGTRVPVIKYNLFHEKINGADTLSFVLGSSHSFYGIDSKLLDGNVFNFASTSQSLMEDYAILKHSKNPIKRVVIPISYFTNWHYLYKTPIGGEKLRTIDYQIYGINYPSNSKSRDIMNFISELSKSILKTDKKSFDIKGNVIGQCDSNGNNIKNAKTAFERHNLGKNFEQINPYLDSINTFCTKNKIDLYFIAMPFSHDYRTYTIEAGFDKYLKIIKAKYNSKNCFILDFRAHFKLSEERFMFSDADHLSFCGRSAFSKFLNEQINFTSSKSNQNHQVSN